MKLIVSQASKSTKTYSSVYSQLNKLLQLTFSHQEFVNIHLFDTRSSLHLTCFVICAMQFMSLLAAKSLLSRTGWSEKIRNEVGNPASHPVTRLCFEIILHYLTCQEIWNRICDVTHRSGV